METMQTIMTRKSTREYKETQISDNDLSKILLAGSLSPVGRRMYNDFRLTVVQSKEVLAILGEKTAKNPLHPGANPFYSAPTLIIVSSRSDTVNQGVYIASAACIIENMHLMVTDLGLGSVLLFGMLPEIRKNPELLTLLCVPSGFTPICALAVGYSVVPLSIRTIPTSSQIIINHVK